MRWRRGVGLGRQEGGGRGVREGSRDESGKREDVCVCVGGGGGGGREEAVKP